VERRAESVSEVTVTYHQEDGHFWGEAGSVFSAADTFQELRTLAREGLEFTYGGTWRAVRAFIVGPPWMCDPIGSETFFRVTETP
jgi:hypothetical protein